MALSALVSLTLTPMMCAHLLRHETPDAPRGRFDRWMEHALAQLTGAYERGLRRVLRHEGWTLASFVAVVATTVYLYSALPKGFFPTQDSGLTRYQLEPASLQALYVKSASGRQVPLSAVATVEYGSTPLAVTHQGQFPAATLSFNLSPGVSLSEATTLINEAAAQLGMPSTVRGSFQGTAQVFTQSLKNESLLILAALLAVYVVLGVLYESLIHSLTILSTLPSAGLGALLALLLVGYELSIISTIGIILLIGIVKKNGIMLVDFALEMERQEGLPPEQSIYRACLLRFRPILMTMVAALLGAVPLALDRLSQRWRRRRRAGTR